jgi:pimeloyl-ACP methyl ester carboxylesterase
MALVLLAFALAVDAVAAAPDNLTCDQAPGNRFFWVEWAFCDLDPIGPAKAQGIIIWNHGISDTSAQWRAPAPLVLRLLQSRGWDVVIIKRHNLAEAGADYSLYRAVERTTEEIRRQRRSGYRKIVLAGQSFGGYVALEAAEQSPDVFAVIAMAPGVRASGAAGRLDPAVTERSLKRLKIERVAVVFPKDDGLFGYMVRGGRANKILSARARPYLLIDETSEITGHAGGTAGAFTLSYGACLNDFLSAPTLAPRRFVCERVPESSVIREVLLPNPRAVKFLDDPGTAPPGLGYLAGRWYAAIDETLILFGLIEGASPPRVWYRWATSRLEGGSYDAAVSGNRIRFTLPNHTQAVVGPGREGPELTWTFADGDVVLTATLSELKVQP